MGHTNQSQADRWLASAGPIPPLVVPGSLEQWKHKRQRIRRQLRRLLGELPLRPRVPAAVTLAREDRGRFIIEKFSFDNGAGATVPGYLLLPKDSSRKAPGILFCHWHGDEYEIGKEELFQARHIPEAPGPALAQRGFAVLGIDACGFGERNGQGPGGHGETGAAAEMTAAKFNLWVGRTLWGMILRDDLMALDYLASRPEVDATRLGVTGISMGATRSWWLMALDERLRSGVAVACLTRYRDLIRHAALPAHGIYYFVPNVLRCFDSEAIVALIAPRPMLFQTGDQDAGAPVDGVQAIGSAVRPVYRLYGAQREFQSIVYPGTGHVYTPEMWVRTLSWMEDKLKR